MLIPNETISLFVNKQVLTNHEIVLLDILDNVKDGTLSINPQTVKRLKQQNTWLRKNGQIKYNYHTAGPKNNWNHFFKVKTLYNEFILKVMMRPAVMWTPSSPISLLKVTKSEAVKELSYPLGLLLSIVFACCIWYEPWK